MADCTGHASISVQDNVATIDIWCTGTCDQGPCKAAWMNTDDIGDLHLTNSFASEDKTDHLMHQIRHYEIRDTVVNVEIPFTCDCGKDARKFFIPIERLEHSTTVVDVLITVLEIVLTMGGSIILRKILSKKPGAKTAQTLKDLKEGFTKAE
jgi:hypothetical protein